ncbi:MULTISPECIES: hypothetical protein [unclassified Bradyrhizobium]|uniref:hypothetical protein n=1 Tax=unclassified Bradyrhizobium TaxID=2631580 RepID=UPI0024E05FDF|nr:MULTISPECIES: hypothetical protein [unclassified Bradyrhizobium]
MTRSKLRAPEKMQRSFAKPSPARRTRPVAIFSGRNANHRGRFGPETRQGLQR